LKHIGSAVSIISVRYLAFKKAEVFMVSSLLLCCTLLLSGAPTVQSKCEQRAPVPVDGKWSRSKDQAVLLIHGYYFQLLDASVPKANFRPWQLPDAALIQELGKKADVFAFAYGQNASIDNIIKESKRRDNVAAIRKLGYKEIILVGHSAGGLIARHFVEDYADTGVTRVVQVCTPNHGAPLADLKWHDSQQAFIDCLSDEGRTKALKDRADKKIPATIQFLCIVTKGDGKTDGVVPCLSQWTDDLHKQGIPAVAVPGTHQVLRNPTLAAQFSELFCSPHPRWTPERIELARKEIFGK